MNITIVSAITSFGLPGEVEEEEEDGGE